MSKAKFQEWLTEEALLRIRGWAKDGLTEEQIAYNMGIGRRTLFSWKNRYEPISLALKESKEIADRHVENALYKRALGYDYEETETFVTTDSAGREQKRIKRVKKSALPDVAAQIFWLKNRKPERWRDKRNVELDASIETNSQALTDEELDAEIEELVKVLDIDSTE